jgi:predicted NUDIX family NTP pyrophosphohydrolase
MPIQSAGLLMCRKLDSQVDFFLIHPGGPYWAGKDEGAWSIPKGLVENDESLLATAQREFFEETGITPQPPLQPLGMCKMKSGKILHAWSFLGEWSPEDGITSNTILIEFPPRSGKRISIPETDRGAWMDLKKATAMINTAQVPFLERAFKHYAEAGM